MDDVEKEKRWEQMDEEVNNLFNTLVATVAEKEQEIRKKLSLTKEEFSKLRDHIKEYVQEGEWL